MSLAEVDKHYFVVNSLLRKRIRDGVPLTTDDLAELSPAFEMWEAGTCHNDEGVGDSTTCLFAGIPDDWVLEKGHVDLCELVDDFTENGPGLSLQPTRDAWSGVVGFKTEKSKRGRRLGSRIVRRRPRR